MPEAASRPRKPVPVILDTDIGGDIDDTWALAMMLKCPELDVKLVVSDTGDTVYRAKIIARLLEIAGRTDIHVGVGIPFDARRSYPQGPWVREYDLASYPGRVHADGVRAIVDTIMGSPEPITLICIGPVPNIHAALSRQPYIATRASFVGMHGSLRVGYGGSPTPCAECNVVNHTDACQDVFTAPWDMTITPLDTCGLVSLSGAKYHAVRDCRDPVTQAVIENYRIWDASGGGKHDVENASSVLFDTVAVYLAFADGLVVIEELGVRVTDGGYTVVDDSAKHMRCATAWRNLGAFEDLLVKRLTS